MDRLNKVRTVAKCAVCSNTEEIIILSDSEEEPIYTASSSNITKTLPKVSVLENEQVLPIYSESSSDSTREDTSVELEDPERNWPDGEFANVKERINRVFETFEELVKKREIITISDDSDTEEEPIGTTDLSTTSNFVPEVGVVENDHIAPLRAEIARAIQNCEDSIVQETIIIVSNDSDIDIESIVSTELLRNERINNTVVSVVNVPGNLDIESNVSVSDININNSVSTVLPITVSNETSSIVRRPSTTTLKRTLEPNLIDYSAPSTSTNNETASKKICLNNGRGLNNLNNVSLESTSSEYPPTYPLMPLCNDQQLPWKNVPPMPSLSITIKGTKMHLMWDVQLSSQTAQIKYFELWVCSRTYEPPNISTWNKVMDIEAKQLPMCCYINFDFKNITYYYALRAVDIHNRRSPFACEEIRT